jgi:hypothetical protein
LAPTVGIAATGFCYPGGILQLFHRQYQQIFSTSSRSTNFATADSSNSHLADPSSPASFVINKSDEVASGRSIFFEWFLPNLQLAMRRCN